MGIIMNHFYIKLKLQSSPNHFAITALIKLAIGSPTPEKVKKTLAMYVYTALKNT